MTTAIEEKAKPCGSRAMKPVRIREAALRLFVQHGYGNVSMDTIAREAGVSKATIYAHFPDKAALFASLMGGECQKQFPDADFAIEPQDLRATLLAVGRAYSDFLARPHAVRVFRMVVAEAPRFPELGRAFFENGSKLMTERVADLLARAQARGLIAVPDARQAARLYLATLRSECFMRTVLGLPPQDAADRAADLEAATDMFLCAYATPAGHDAATTAAAPPRPAPQLVS